MPHQWLSALVGPMRAPADSRADGQLHDQQAPSTGRESPVDSKNGSLAGNTNGFQAGGKSGSTDSSPIRASEQQIQCPEESADVKAQALEALDSAFCMHIYSTALKHLRKMFSYEVVIKQFSAILDGDELDDVMNSSIANCLTNMEKNRYRDIVPYDSNRVELPPMAAAAGKGSSNGAAGQPGSLIRTNSAPSTRGTTYDDTYINASFISDPETITEPTNSGSYSRQAVGYIATQGPLPNTVADFWRMAAAVDISAIVMLTELTMANIGHGSSRALCAAYFPDQMGASLKLPGGISVTCVHKARLSESLLFRQLEVVCPVPQQSQQKRLWVNHYKIADWPDFGVPKDSVAVRALSHALDGCRRAGCKIVVHCSAGVGRTGTFIAVDVILQRLHSLTLQAHGSITDDDVRATVDIQALVAGLRKQRRGTVQTSEQYAFIWQAVIDEIEVLLQQERQSQQQLQELAAALRQDLLVQ